MRYQLQVRLYYLYVWGSCWREIFLKKLFKACLYGWASPVNRTGLPLAGRQDGLCYFSLFVIFYIYTPSKLDTETTLRHFVTQNTGTLRNSVNMSGP